MFLSKKRKKWIAFLSLRNTKCLFVGRRWRWVHFKTYLDFQEKNSDMDKQLKYAVLNLETIFFLVFSFWFLVAHLFSANSIWNIQGSNKMGFLELSCWVDSGKFSETEFRNFLPIVTYLYIIWGSFQALLIILSFFFIVSFLLSNSWNAFEVGTKYNQ